MVLKWPLVDYRLFVFDKYYKNSIRKPLNILTSDNTTTNLNSLKSYDHASVFVNNLLRLTA